MLLVLVSWILTKKIDPHEGSNGGPPQQFRSAFEKGWSWFQSIGVALACMYIRLYDCNMALSQNESSVDGLFRRRYFSPHFNTGLPSMSICRHKVKRHGSAVLYRDSVSSSV